MTTSVSALTFSDFKDLVYTVLDDANQTGQYSDVLVFHATVGALYAILPWCPKPALQVYTGDGTTYRFDLPIDLYRIEAVQDVDSGLFLNRALFSPGQYRQTATTPTNTNWLIYPKGKLWINKVYELDKQVNLYYQAYYTAPISESDDAFVFETPRSAVPGMVYWAAAHCLFPKSTSGAVLNAVKTRIDSGTPLDNVLQQAAEFYRRLFIDEMNRQPKYIGA